MEVKLEDENIIITMSVEESWELIDELGRDEEKGSKTSELHEKLGLVDPAR